VFGQINTDRYSLHLMPPHCDLLSTITLGSFPGRKRAPSTTSGPQAQLLRQAAALPVLGVPDANLAQSRHDLSQVQGSADDMVPRHLSSDAKQKRYFRA
jgi:hypothetical protein